MTCRVDGVAPWPYLPQEVEPGELGIGRRETDVAEIKVNPGDLALVADTYRELAARAAQISPQAALEVQRIAETHGPMGYPTAIGVTAGLAKAEGPLTAKVADFTAYSHRFTEHAATYTREDAEAAERIDSTVLPTSAPISRGAKIAPIADTGFTPSNAIRTPAEGGPLTGVLDRSEPGLGGSWFTDIGLADFYAHKVAPHMGHPGTGPPLGGVLDRWADPDIQTPKGSTSIVPGTEPRRPAPPDHI